MTHRLKEILHYINIVGFIYLLSTVIFSSFQVHLVGLYLFFASYGLEVIWEKRWREIRWSSRTFYFGGVLLFFSWALLSFFDSTPIYLQRLIEKRLPLLGFGLVGLFGVNEKYNLKLLLYTIIIAITVALSYMLFVEIGIVNLWHSSREDMLFRNAREVFFHSHPLFDFYINLALISLWYLSTYRKSSLSQWTKYIYLIWYLFLLFSLSFSEGRTGQFFGYILTLFFLLHYLWKCNRKWIWVVGVALPLLLFFVVGLNPRMSKKMLQDEPRTAFLWKSGVEVVEEEPLWGSGVSDAQERFDVRRAENQTESYRLTWAFADLLDAHNQYLQTAMEYGIFGLLLLLYLYLAPLFIVERRHKIFVGALFVLCAYTSIWGMFLTGHFALIFGIITVMTLRLKLD